MENCLEVGIAVSGDVGNPDERARNRRNAKRIMDRVGVQDSEETHRPS